MLRNSALKALFALVVAGGMTAAAYAAEFGTEAEAKAMLEKAVAAVKANKADALAEFTKGEGGFKDRDLYPFCGGPDGIFTAHPTLVGKSLKEVKDKAGKPWASRSTRKLMRVTSCRSRTCGRVRQH